MSFRLGLPMGAWRLTLIAAALLSAAGQAEAAEFDSLFAGTNDYGDAGLLQTPTARMRADADFGFGVSTVRPYDQAHLFFQALPWLELVGRYTDVTDEPYLPVSPATTNEHYKDKSVDFKVRLLNEGRLWPELSLGVQDFGGTGLFSSEYLVSSYHWYDLDFSFGLAWGRLGSGGSIHNPLTIFDRRHFDIDRYTSTSSTSAGGLGLGRLFTGETIGPFGGVEWLTPVRGLALRLEYDGNDYQHEAFGNNQKQNSRINEGLAYRGLRDVDVGVAWERGDRIMARVAIYTNFQSLWRTAKTADPAPLALPKPPPAATEAPQAPPSAPAQPVAPSAAESTAPKPAAPVLPPPPPPPPAASKEEQSEFVLRLKAALKQQGFTLIAVDYDSFLKEVRVWLNQDRYRNPAKAVGRTTRAVAAVAPAEISKFTLIFVDQGVENYRAAVYRKDFEKAVRDNNPDLALSSVVLGPPGQGYDGAQYFDDTWLPKFSWNTGPAVRQSIGAPGSFYTGQLYWSLSGSLAVTEHLNFSAAAGFNIVNNFSQLQNEPTSTLPHVRSDIVEYLQQGKYGMTNLEADYTWAPYPEWYHRVSAGIFEWMYGGAATELLYRPYGRSWAVALDVNRVRQRGFDETFTFLPYTVTTGKATLYYQPGYYNLLFKLSAGKYLAGDKGGTIDISRKFDSGIRLGLFATKTNVSAAQFGEGSFDKGAYVVLPLDLFFAQSTRREAEFVFRPLTRDGGQMVYDGPELYYTVKDGQPSDFAKGAGELLR